ncbi:MAG: glycolate oxidase subunit GlcE [Casimicrobium sp.]
MIESWQNQIKAAAAKGEKLTIRGSGSKSFLAPEAQGEVLDTRAHAGIVEYDPKELVIVVRCGIPVAEVEQTMAAANQMLAFEPPHFGEDATIGGMVASSLSGPRRPYAGAVRDFVLGCKVLDGKGDHLSFGGKVMKNVAGFDVSRLITGSMGTLGVITEASFKCLPLPKAQQTRVFEMDAQAAIVAMNRWYAEANPVTATTWVNDKLYVRLAGAEPAVNSAVAKLGGEALANDVDWWRAWREQVHAFFAGDGPLIRVSCRSTAPWGDLANNAQMQAIDWGGAQRWLRTQSVALPAIREWARAEGGHATVFRGATSQTDRIEPLQPALAEVSAKIKASFDPYNVFPSLL